MKKWFEPMSTAWVGVASHKLRSSLTILGVVIGVGAVIALMAVGKGAEVSILSGVESLGSNLLFVRPGEITEGGVRVARGSAATLTLEDAVAITEEVPYIASVAPVYSRGLRVIVGGQNMRARITGITPEYQQVFNLQMSEGDFISEYQYQRRMKVAVLGPDVKERLFSADDPIGQRMRIGRIIVHVIGVLESKGESVLGSTDDAVLIPLTALYETTSRVRTSRGDSRVSSIIMEIDDPEYNGVVVGEITQLLRYRHQLVGDGEDDDFIITSQEDIIEMLSQAMSSMTLLLAAIAAISLLVGGIGVMNIMLVSVVERTREIGIRKALGAREGDIWMQFLIEAAFLTFAGGIIGVAVGWGASYLISYLGTMPTVVSVEIVLLAVSVAVGIGLFFGFYPAWHASRLDPIEALRAE